MGKLDGQVAFITGGARGLGRSHAVLFASEGANIVICDALTDVPSAEYEMSTQAELDETVRLVEEQGVRCLALQADVRRPDQLEKVVEAAVAEFGRIDILIANAGILSMVPVAEMSSEVWKDMIDVNLTGVFNSIRSVLSHMTERGYGRIVVMSSGAGLIGFKSLAHYCAAKWGVIGLAKSVALEVIDRGVTVNIMLSTNANTYMIQNESTRRAFLPGVENPTEEELREAFVINPMGLPWVEPIDVSNAMLFLVSPESRYITGQSIGPLAGSGAMNGAA